MEFILISSKTRTMKINISIILIALLTSCFIACNNPVTGNRNSTIHTDTSAMKQVTVTDEIYTCTMHNEVISNEPGKCPRCGMTLVKQKITNEQMKMMKEGNYVKPK